MFTNSSGQCGMVGQNLISMKMPMCSSGVSKAVDMSLRHKEADGSPDGK